MMRVEARFEHAEDAIRLPYARAATCASWRCSASGTSVEWAHGQGTVELPRFTTTESLELASR